jgi:hypothetical protein
VFSFHKEWDNITLIQPDNGSHGVPRGFGYASLQWICCPGVDTGEQRDKPSMAKAKRAEKI